MKLQTVEIVDRKGSGERRVINAADFDPDTDTRWDDREAPKARRGESRGRKAADD